MRRLIYALAFLPTVAYAQQPPAQSISIPGPLAAHIFQYLNSGGTYVEGQSLSVQLQEAVQEPQKEAARKAEEQKRIDEAVAAAKKQPEAEPKK